METRFLRNSNETKTLTENGYFLLPFLMIFIFSTLTISLIGNSEAFHFINEHHSTIADFWFLSFTNLGDGKVAFLTIFILMWISFREAFSLLLITLIITILIFLLKNVLFPDFERPILFFGEQMIRLVPGYQPPKLHSFPSGHTATAFSLYLYIAFLTKKKGVKFVLFLVASLVGYSRIYLSAHFPADVVVGSLLATLVTILVYLYSERIKSSWLDQKIVYNRHKMLARQTI